jgi:hypothetical protein
MAQILEARITEGFADMDKLPGFIHSQFSRSCNIWFPMPDRSFRLIAILPVQFTGMPDSLAVEEAFFDRISKLPIGSPVVKNGLAFEFAGIPEVLAGSKETLSSSALQIKTVGGS